MQTWACLPPMALSQDSTSFQPSGLFSKIRACFRWPLAQYASKVSLDTSIPTVASLILATSYSGRARQGSASGNLVHGISGLPRPWIPFGMNSGAWRSGAISTAQVWLTEGTHGARRFPCCFSEILSPAEQAATYKGRPLLATPRTDPYVRLARIRLLPRVFDGEADVWPRV